MARLATSLIVLVAILGCVSAVQWTTYTGIGEPFAAYGKIDPTHHFTVDNFNAAKTQQFYYAANNLPAQRNEVLYQFTALWTVNGAATPKFSLHIVTVNGEKWQFQRTIPNLTGVSGEPIDLAHLNIDIPAGAILVVSSPDDSVKFRVGANNIGNNVAYGILTIATDDLAQVNAGAANIPHAYAAAMVESTNDHGEPLAAGLKYQLCASYGTYEKRSNWIAENLMIWVPRDIIVDIGAGSRVIKEFKIMLEDDAGFPYNKPDVSVEIVIAVKKTITYTNTAGAVPVVVTETVWQYDATRTRTFTGVQSGVTQVIPDFQFVNVVPGEMVGFHVKSPSASSKKVKAVWTHDDPAARPGAVQEAFYVFNDADLAAGPQEGAPKPTLLVNAETYDTPNFVFKTGGSGGSTLNGDPQFAGFHGQSYQFHGLADEMFNLISTPTMQLNSHFVYLSSGKCGYNNTVCFQHPGTYVDALGFTIPSAQGEMQIKMVAGSHEKGLRVWMGAVGTDLHEVHLGHHSVARWSIANESTEVAELRYTAFGEATVRTPVLDIKVINSDYFFNLEISMLDQRALRIGAPKHTVTDHTICDKDQNAKAQVETHREHQHSAVEAALLKKYKSSYPMHGLIGQTWRNVMVCGKHWMGAVNDYVVDSLFSNDYYFNYYSKSA